MLSNPWNSVVYKLMNIVSIFIHLFDFLVHMCQNTQVQLVSGFRGHKNLRKRNQPTTDMKQTTES